MLAPRGKRPFRLPCIVVAFVLLAWARPAWPHGIEWRADAGRGFPVLFLYDDGAPVAFGEVTLHSPASSEKAYQRGGTDENGYFSFRPNTPGLWKFVCADGKGHTARGEIQITEADLPGAANGDAPPRPAASGGAGRPGRLQIILGLSILLNLALAGAWRLAKKRPAPATTKTAAAEPE